MNTPDYSGLWTGEMSGTNHGGFTFELHQDGAQVSGIATFSEPALGSYEYKVTGTASATLSLQLVPGRQSGGIFLGNVSVVGSLQKDGRLSGRWQSTIGTQGVFEGKRFNASQLSVELPKPNSVFIVHGHDDGTKHAVARFLERIGVQPVILQEQINNGRTVIEKFEKFAERAGFAVILITPDDFGYAANRPDQIQSRPRQNVVLELGYFAAKLGRERTLVLVKGEVEMPSDVIGLVYERFDSSEGWKIRLAKELKGANFEVDLNRALD